MSEEGELVFVVSCAYFCWCVTGDGVPMKEKWVVYKYVILLILTMLGIATIFFISSPQVEGTKRWATYTGVLLEFDIDCSQCCHPSSYFRINTSDGVKSELIGDCDEGLEHLVRVGQVYTIQVEPYPEPYAITRSLGEPGYFWAVQIDWIKDLSGRIIYGSEWL